MYFASPMMASYIALPPLASPNWLVAARARLRSGVNFCVILSRHAKVATQTSSSAGRFWMKREAADVIVAVR